MIGIWFSFIKIEIILTVKMRVCFTIQADNNVKKLYINYAFI